VDDGFRIAPDPSTHQQDQAHSVADGGKTELEIHKSATGCNQDPDDQDLFQAEGVNHDRPS
jgi:hypothetical protein